MTQMKQNHGHIQNRLVVTKEVEAGKGCTERFRLTDVNFYI